MEKAEERWTSFVEAFAKVLHTEDKVFGEGNNDRLSDRVVVDLLIDLNENVTTKASLTCDPVITVQKVCLNTLNPTKRNFINVLF